MGRRIDMNSIQKQRGFLIPIALFIVVGLAALALVVMRFTSATFNAAVQEVISVQALYVAETGGQIGMHSITYNVTDPAVADSQCTAVDGQRINFNVATTKGCSAELSCERITSSGTTRVYTIESTAYCGGGDLSVTRRVAYTTML